MGDNLCLDEMMIPYFGTRGSRVYMKNKPCPWGFKAYTLCDSFGILYNVHMAAGPFPQVEGFPDLGSTYNRCLDMCKIIPKKT